MKKAAKTTLFCLACLWAANVSATTYYVATTGSNTSGNGSSGAPWATVVYALTKVSSGDVISINDGIYSEEQLAVPVGVSLTSTSQDNTKVKVHPNANLSSTAPFILLSSDAGTNGAQMISHLEIDGIEGAYRAYLGIRIVSRDNVTIDHCYIHDFYGLEGAFGVDVYSGSGGLTDTWDKFFPADPQAPGNDTNLDTLWLANPVENLEISNNAINDCGWKLTAENRKGSIGLFNIKNSAIHHNTFDNTVSNGQCITGRGQGKTGVLWNVDIYENTLDLGSSYTDASSWTIEFWVMRGGCQVYNNVSYEGGFSITVGKETTVNDNTILFSTRPTAAKSSYAVEFTNQSYAKLYGNFAKHTKGLSFNAGAVSGGKAWQVSHVDIYRNISIGDSYAGIVITANGSVSGASTSYINVYNNVIDGSYSPSPSSPTAVGIRLKQENPATSTMNNVNVKNNVVVNCSGYAGLIKNTVTGVSIDKNLFYKNGINDWQNGADTNTYISDPNFNNPGSSYTGYTPEVPSDCIDNGVDVGLPYNGSAPDIGVIETGTSVSAINISSDKLKVYPNPVSSILTISGMTELDGNNILGIFDSLGREVSQPRKAEGDLCRFNMSSFPPGVYNLKLTDSRGRQVVRKIVKE